jgi:hypothetical protein
MAGINMERRRPDGAARCYRIDDSPSETLAANGAAGTAAHRRRDGGAPSKALSPYRAAVRLEIERRRPDGAPRCCRIDDERAEARELGLSLSETCAANGAAILGPRALDTRPWIAAVSAATRGHLGRALSTRAPGRPMLT